MPAIELMDAELLVANLRTPLSRAELSENVRWDDLVASYNAAVTGLNKELQRCLALARRGLTGEAIQRVESEKLLELATVLDVPEWESWSNILREFNVELDSIDQPAAEAINRLYAPHQRIESLLRQQRRLALARESIQKRLAIMRRLRADQPHNSLLADDVKLFERARLAEIREELSEAAKRADRSMINTLHRELTAKNWLERPEAALVEQAQRIADQLHRKEAARRVDEAAEQLHASWLEKNIEDGKRWLQEWERWLPEADLPESSPAYVVSENAREWLNRIMEIEAAEADYSTAIDRAASLCTSLHWRRTWRKHREELEQARYELERTSGHLGDIGADPPEDRAASFELVERQIALRLEEIVGIERSRRLLALVASVASIFVLGVIIIGSATYFRHREEIANHIASLQRLIDDEDLTGATAYIQSLPLSLKSESVIAQLIGTHEELLLQEENRRTNFQTLYGTLLADIDNAESRDLVSLDARLQQMKKVATNEADKTLIIEAEHRVSEKRRSVQQKVDQDFVERFAKLRQDIANLETGNSAGLRELDNALEKLLQEPGISSEILIPAKALAQANKVTFADWQNEKEHRDLLASIRESLGDVARYQEKLKLYIEKFPKRSRSEEFRRVLDRDAATWGDIKPWSEVIAEINRTPIPRIAPDKAKSLAARIQALVTSLPGHPAAATARQILPYLDAIGARIEADSTPLQSKLGSIIDNPTIAHLYMVKLKTGECYYSDKPPEESKTGGWTIRAFRSIELSDDRDIKFIKSDKINVPGTTRDAWLSPQSKFADAARPFVASGIDEKWDKRAMHLLELIHHSEDMDPILKAQLYDQVLPIVVKGSFPAQKALKTFSEQLARATFDKSVNFIGPADKEAERQRDLAQIWIRRMPDPTEAQAEIARDLEQLEKVKLSPQLTWVGYLIKDAEDHWTSALGQGARDGDLVLAYPDAEKNMVITPLGEANGSDVKISAPPGADWLQGRLIFLRPRNGGRQK